MARSKAATAVVAVLAIAVGVGGGAYLWKEWSQAANGDAHADGGVVRDASADARAGRGKAKAAKKGGRGKPRASVGPRPVANNGGGANNGGPNPTDDSTTDEVPADEVEEFHPPFRGRGPAGPTYETAIAGNKQEIEIGARGERDLTDAQLTGPLGDGSFVSECGAPESMKVTVKVAVKQGHAAGVSIFTRPHDADIAGCIDRYVRTFSWPSSGKMDSFTTTY